MTGILWDHNAVIGIVTVIVILSYYKSGGHILKDANEVIGRAV